MKKAPGAGAFFSLAETSLTETDGLHRIRGIARTQKTSRQTSMLTVKNPGIPGFHRVPAEAFSDSYTFVMYLKENPMECKAAGVGQ